MMKFLDEYREYDSVQRMAREIARWTTRSWTIMEVCGGQTYTIVKSGLQELLPPTITLVHGPGCPVCVTPVAMIDRAVATAMLPEVILCSFGDMLRVPGSTQSLLDAKSLGADVRIVYSPLDALQLARSNPAREIVFFAVGFETTAPANAMAVWQAEREGLSNFSMLVSHVLVPPAMEAVLASSQCQVQAFLAAGHACMVTGYEEYLSISDRHKVPIVVTGFEPLDLLEGVLMLVKQLESGSARVENQYTRAVLKEGNLQAQARVVEVFEVTHRAWRGIGEIASSGLRLRERYRRLDAETKFGLQMEAVQESDECIAGLVLQGLKRPYACPAFGTRCNPDTPLGAPMVSSEGACAAYFHFGRRKSDGDSLVSLATISN
jgi:hydrogenase expression/formation protein HypD